MGFPLLPKRWVGHPPIFCSSQILSACRLSAPWEKAGTRTAAHHRRNPRPEHPACGYAWRWVGSPTLPCPAHMGWCALGAPSLTSIEKRIALLNWLANYGCVLR